MALWRVLDYTKLNEDIAEIIFDLGFDWRKKRDSLRDIQIITCFKFHFILTLIFCNNVAITPGLQTTVSSVVWSARSHWKPRHCFTSRLPTRSNPLSATSKQNEQANFCLFVLFGGSEGIRTPEPVKTTRFPIVPVMTTSIRFHITFLF